MKENISQLELALKEAKQPQERLVALFELADHLRDIDFVKCEALSIEAIDIAKLLNNQLSLAKSYELLGTALWKLAEHDDSMENYDIALDKYLMLSDLHGAARCYTGKGIICGTLSEYQSALEYFEQGLVASKKVKCPQLSTTIVGNIGHVYFQLGRYNDALDCFNHGLESHKELDDPSGKANMLGGMAGVYVYQGEMEKGMDYVRHSLKLHTQEGNARGVATSLMNLGITLRKMTRLEKAKVQLLDALKYTQEIKLRSVEFEVHKNLSRVYSELGMLNESDTHLNAYLELEKEEKRENLKRTAEQRKQRQQLKGL